MPAIDNLRGSALDAVTGLAAVPVAPGLPFGASAKEGVACPAMDGVARKCFLARRPRARQRFELLEKGGRRPEAAQTILHMIMTQLEGVQLCTHFRRRLS